MANIATRARHVEQLVGLSELQEKELEAELWKAEHDQAALAFAVQGLGQDVLNLYGEICRLDEEWTVETFRNPSLFDEASDRRLRALFASWCAVARRSLANFESIRADYVARGFDEERFARLKAAIDECNAALHPSDVETELADEALASNRRGETVPMESIIGGRDN